jgi:hypothetical protein
MNSVRILGIRFRFHWGNIPFRCFGRVRREEGEHGHGLPSAERAAAHEMD